MYIEMGDMVDKGFIFFKEGKIPFVIENYRMELFSDDSLLDDFCKEYNFKENYILHGQCFDIGIRGRKATFFVENSMGSTCYLRCYIINLLDSLTEGARAAVIVPQSSMTGKTKDEQSFKESIMKNHTLEGVITCNTDTFYGVGTNPVIAVFTAHEPHPDDKVCKFIDFRNDGYEVRAHIGLVEGDSAKDKRQHLLDVWFGRTEAASKFCVESTVKADDEWLHSFFYFNDEKPTDADFEKAIGDYLTFEFSMIIQNRDYLFKNGGGDIAED